MSDEERHPVVQSMIDVIEEVMDPAAAAAKKKAERQTKQNTAGPKIIELTPEMAIMLRLLQMGLDPRDLGIDIDDDEDNNNT